ncbi:MBL fold metallo-hydrolase [Anaerophilus nitritogenes]|uniref:MBL fold metallo-hydrolase n=1 Tax=Anaerophilus nitritogenes TaxID=2498136 RepID=UPI00101D3978|nr:MBL fold metallo-hydrolase [Anaerophilus nitritogenes]
MYKKIINIFRWMILISIIFYGYRMIHLKNTSSMPQDTPVEISFLALKEDADSILIQQGLVNILIDTGEKKDAQKIINYLQEKKVSNIEYLILTHPDKDHIGSGIDIIKHFEVKNIIQPYYQKKNERLEKLNQEAKRQGIPIIYPTLNRKFIVGNMKLLVYPPMETHYKKDNNYSLVTLIKHGKVKMLFTGDAEKKRLEEMLLMNLKNIDLLKIPHHGRANIYSEQFIKALSPTYGVVTSYDADEIIKKTCKEINTKIFYTGTGDKIFNSNGEVLTHIPMPNR